MKTGEKWSAEEAGEFADTMMKYDTNGDGKFSYAGRVIFVYQWHPSKQRIPEETMIPKPRP